MIFRVLLATIRNLGSCPCPRCLIPKQKIPEVGMKLDDRRRESTKRVADTGLWSTIKTVRTLIYNQALGVKSAAVERVLSTASLVPTMVCFILSPIINKLTELYVRMLFILY